MGYKLKIAAVDKDVAKYNHEKPRRGPKPKYPWRTAKIGDRFPMDVSITSARTMASGEGRRTNRKFSVTTDKKGVVICTRVK